MPKNKQQNPKQNTERATPDPANAAPEGHDAHGTPFKRVAGPGPNDAGKGAAGAEVIKRLEGGFEPVESEQEE